MGKASGFLEYQRQVPPDRPPEERVNDWEEFHLLLPEDVLRQQAARCMDCGVPFCHTGNIVNGLAVGCPLKNLIPEWNDLVYRGLWQQALERLALTNNFPEFTSRVCPAPCEGSCVLGSIEPAVTIKNIEHAIIDKGFESGWVAVSRPTHRSGKRVAVVGSGPSGLAAADELNKLGHHVTVFERAERAGGLLTYGIPNMKLDKGIVQRRVDILSAGGVEFVTNTEVGRDYPAERLEKEFDAIVLCCGATKPRDLPVEGRELKGIHFAVDFLSAATRQVLGVAEEEGLHAIMEEAIGKDVVVIGGGDTGTDCIATSLRQGCRSVTQFEIMDRPPLERAPDNPWPLWPKIYRVDYGQEEAAVTYGEDPRRFSIKTTHFEGDVEGRVKAVHTVRVAWRTNGNGRPEPVDLPGTEEVWPAQLVLLAMGFTGPESFLLEALAVERDVRTNVKTDRQSYATSVEGVFAAGDARRGQSLVVWAIREGREAAVEVDEFLKSR
jgi:glutamate synthase (NADPH) small chain